MLGVPGQYKSIALTLGYKLNFSCCVNKVGCCRDSPIVNSLCHFILHGMVDCSYQDKPVHEANYAFLVLIWKYGIAQLNLDTRF